MKQFIQYLYTIILGGLALSCSGPETVGTQTGNPATLSLHYQFAQEDSRDIQSRGNDSLVSQLTITETYIVLDEVRIFNDSESLSFKREEPYILTYQNSITQLLDSIVTETGKSFDKLELRIDKVDTSTYEELIDNAIVVKGFIDGDSSVPFLFKASITEKIEYISDVTIEEEDSEITLSFKTHQWFVNEAGDVLDPRESANKSEIISNIKSSLKILSN